MRNMCIGIFIGMVITGTAWAASSYIKLQSADGIAISSTNPLPIQSY
jgi:hypothetical protein